MESLINSTGIFSEKFPKVSVTVPRFRLITPTQAYAIGSFVDSDNTVREWHIFVFITDKMRKIMIRNSSLIRQSYYFSTEYQRNTSRSLTRKMQQSRTRRHSPEMSSLTLRYPP